MSRGKNKKRRNKWKFPTPTAQKKGKNINELAEHQRDGKKLLSQISQLRRKLGDEKVTSNSWLDEGFPESLWVALLLTYFDREQIFPHQFIRISKFLKALQHDSHESFPDLSHSAISRMPEGIAQKIVNCICDKPETQFAISPVLFFESLPGRKYWNRAISERASKAESTDMLLATGVACHHHQTLTSTDCRWLSVFFYIFAGKLHMPQEIREKVTRYAANPDNALGAIIRAMEMPIRQTGNDWGDNFWKECLDKLPCIEMNTNNNLPPVLGTSKDIVSKVAVRLRAHCDATRAQAYMNVRHDAVFGSAMYAIRILEELLRVSNCTGVLGRLGLRTILEVCITLRHLAKKDSEELWGTWRAYGTGQAKMSALKAESAKTIPNFANPDKISDIANEDKSNFFTDITLGNWAGTNLRKISEEIGDKDLYDEFYDWTSAYAHGNWAAIRDSVMQTCGHPLHRRHGIPHTDQLLGDVLPDACRLVDMILVVVDKIYPEFPDRISIKSP